MLLWKRTVHEQQVSGRYPLSKPTDIQRGIFEVCLHDVDTSKKSALTIMSNIFS